MKWTYDWLTDYLKTDATPATIAATLTRIGLEIEDVSAPIPPIAAKIVECTPHENSDHLHVLRVDDGTGNLRQVVCGAPNARVGLISALARPGCVIDGHVIQSGKLRGVVSDGMMCSARELGIGNDHDGIIELPDDTKIGSPVVDTPVVFDASITPNRPDYLAVRGIARDLAAAGVGEYITPADIALADVNTTRRVNVKTDKCPIYRFAEINGITVRDSHTRIAHRLRAIGINPKNAPVDATNYICFDMGQPMHCFDADEIHGDITVRMAGPGEQFTDLFGNTHTLTDTDMVIADDDGILALAGIVGGARGMMRDDTKNIILESAYFDPVSVRKTARRLGISTDASYRYERGIDPTITAPALRAAADIIMDACGGKIVGTGTGGAGVADTATIKYKPELFRTKTGIDMPADVQMDILQKLGFDVVANGNDWMVTPRAARVDVTIPETIVAELVRIYGYDKIAENATHRGAVPVMPAFDMDMHVKTKLAARGLNESKSFGFGSSVVGELISDAAPIRIANPITADLDTARGNLLGNMLLAVAGNDKRGYPDMAMFEVGTVFTGDAPSAQHTEICIVRTGATSPRHWTGRNRDVDIYDVKSDLVALIGNSNFAIETQTPPRWAHPYRYGRIMRGKKSIGEFGELSPVVAKKMGIKTNVVVGIINNIDDLPTPRVTRNITMSEFMPITRDFAFITGTDAHAGDIVAAARGADARITDVVVFDAFKMNDGEKSIAFTITILPDKNMSDADLMEIQNAVICAVEKKCGAKIRDK